jgi:hypothetical protein
MTNARGFGCNSPSSFKLDVWRPTFASLISTSTAGPKCRTAVWSDYGHKVDLRFVRVSTLDEPGILKPDATLFGWL